MCPHFEGPEDAPTAADLFAGCGGMTWGLMSGGFRVVAAWEKADMPRVTYHQHHCEANNIALHRDATDVDASKLPDDLDLLAGGPPCKGFSSAQGETNTDDPRNRLAFSMVDWAAAVEPKLVLIENVTGLYHSHRDTLSELTDALADVGYQVKLLTLNAVNYGVPQTRKRLFILGVRDDIAPPDQWEPPRVCNEGQQRLTDINGGDWLEGYTTAHEALSDLPEPLKSQPAKDDPIHHTLAERFRTPDNAYTRTRVDPGTVSAPVTRDGDDVWLPTNHKHQDHSRAHREKMAEYELGKSGPPTTARRLDPDKPAPTMTHSDGTPPVHYIGKTPSNNESVDDVRRLTVREVARIQTFIDPFTFAGTRTEQYEMVANAVPPVLASNIATHLRTNILSTSQKQITPATTATSKKSVKATE